jgi:hypothetical protein
VYSEYLSLFLSFSLSLSLSLIGLSPQPLRDLALIHLSALLAHLLPSSKTQARYLFFSILCWEEACHTLGPFRTGIVRLAREVRCGTAQKQGHAQFHITTLTHNAQEYTVVVCFSKQ